MGSKRKKKGAPAIVPRFLKGAVTVGAIPALVAACAKPMKPPPPVVAYMGGQPAPEDAATPVTPPPVVAAYQVQPVVAAYAVDAGPVQPPQPPVVAAHVPHPLDAGVDAPPAAKKKKVTRPDAALPPPPVVAAMVAPPPVVAAYVAPSLPPTKKR